MERLVCDFDSIECIEKKTTGLETSWLKVLSVRLTLDNLNLAISKLRNVSFSLYSSWWVSNASHSNLNGECYSLKSTQVSNTELDYCVSCTFKLRPTLAWASGRFCSGMTQLTSDGYWTRNRKLSKPTMIMMTPGTMNERPQLDSTKMLGITVPKMFPIDVCEFHTPKIKPVYTRHANVYC